MRGRAVLGGHYHSQSPEAYFAHTPGLKVVMPSNPVDAKGLLLSSIRQNDPVIFMEPKRVYRASRGDVPEGDFEIPLGEAKVVREGKQITLIAWSAMVHTATEAAEKAAAEGIDAEVIDLRTIVPFDIETLVTSVQKTGRCVIAQEAPRTCGFASELIATICERAMQHLEAPITRVSGLDTPFPYTLEHEYLPNADRIVSALRQTLEW